MNRQKSMGLELAIFLFVCGCFGGSGQDIYLQDANFNPGDVGNGSYSAVIGNTVRVFQAQGQGFFEEPIALTLKDSLGRKFPVAHAFDESQNLTFQVPPKINSGTAQLEVTDKNHETPLTGELFIRRLGVLASSGNHRLIIFDSAQPSLSQVLDLESVGGDPEDIAISPDGRFAEISLAGSQPGTIAVDLTSDPPSLASAHRPALAAPHEISFLSDTLLGLVPNTGESSNPGETVEVYALDGQGRFAQSIDQINVGPQGMPFAVAAHMADVPFVLISNRSTTTPRLTRIDLQQCQSQAATGCSQSIFTTLSRDVPTDLDPELTGVAVHPNGEWAWVADYRNAKIYTLSVGQGQLQKNPGATVSLDQGGGQGPVAIRISPGGGRVFVLNEISSTLSVLRFQGSSLTFDFSIALGGERPTKMNFSHEGKKLWISFRGSNQVKMLDLNLFRPRLSSPLDLEEVNQPKGIAIQP